MYRPPTLLLALATLALAACGGDQSITAPFGPGAGVAWEAVTAEDSAAHLAAGRPGAATGSFMLQAASGMVFEEPGGFKVEVVSTSCAAQGNTVTVTSPVSATLTTNACADQGATRRFEGPFDAGTAITLGFHSGYTGGPGAARVSGSYPVWTVAFEDGFDNDFNDVVVQVTIFSLETDCPPTDYFDDPFFQNGLRVLWDLSYPDKPIAEQHERLGFVVPDGSGGFRLETMILVDSDACGILGPEPHIYDQIPDGAIAYVHTHPSTTGSIVPPGACQNVPGGSRLGSGPSSGDVDYIGFLERGFGREFDGIIIEPDGVYQFDDENPAGTRYANCDIAG